MQYLHLPKLILPAMMALATPAFGADFKTAYDAYIDGDYQPAYQDFLPLAEAGNSDAVYYVAVLYDEGKGVMAYYEKATKYFHLAAKQCHPQAQFHLSQRYVTGKGVMKDIYDAHMWAHIAGENGVMRAIPLLDALEPKMSSGDISLSKFLAKRCLERAYQDC